MSKLALLLALLAAGLSGWVLLQRSQTSGGAVTRGGGGHEDLRSLMREVRDRLDDAVKDKQKNVDWRIARLEKLQQTLDAGIASVQSTAEDAAQANYGMLEAMREDLKRTAGATRTLETLGGRLDALEARIKALEERPAQVVKEVIRERGGGEAQPDAPTGPKVPKLPVGPQKDPAQVEAEIRKAREDLKSDDAALLFGAIDKIREHRVMDALPRLLELLAKHDLDIIRGNAAAALGKMRVADAVPALAEALLDKSELVAMEANSAILSITDFDTELAASAGMRRRRAARNKVKEWWRDHEGEVRERLGQPAPGG